MSQAKAVVLEKNNNTITVLTRDGAFQTLRYKRDVEVGEEILLPTPNKVPLWRIGTSIAAVFLLTFMGIFGWNAFQPRTAVAMISLDINPSLQLTVDQKGKVLELESLNSEAEQLAASLSLIGKPWGEALNKIIEESVTQNYFDEQQSWVVIGYSSVESEKEGSGETINTEAISKQVQQAVKEQGLKPTLAVYELTPDQKKKAHETGLSLGEYALIDSAHKAGVEVKPEAIKDKEELSRLLDIPEIQKQMRTDENNQSNSRNKKDMDKIKAMKDKESLPQKNPKEQPLNDRNDKKKDEGSKIDKDDKGNSRGKSDRDNDKNNDKGKKDGYEKNEKIEQKDDSKNQDKSNKEVKPRDKSNGSNYEESWQGVDFRSILRLNYSQYN